MVGKLKHIRHGYTSAVEVPRYVCDLLDNADNIDSDDFLCELVGEKMNASIKNMSWKEEEIENETLPILEDELLKILTVYATVKLNYNEKQLM